MSSFKRAKNKLVYKMYVGANLKKLFFNFRSRILFGRSELLRAFVFANFLGLLFVSQAFAQVPDLLPFQGRLTDSNGNVIDYAVTVNFRIYPPTGNCYLYEDTQTVTPNDFGVFSTLLGVGGNSTGPANNFKDVFENTTALVVPDSCAGTYSPATNDWRRLEVIVDGNPLPDMQTIGTTAFAFHSATLNGFTSSDFIQVAGNVTQANLDTLTGGGDASGLHHHDSIYSRNDGSTTYTGNVTTATDFIGTGAGSQLALGLGTPMADIHVYKAAPTFRLEALNASGGNQTIEFYSNGAQQAAIYSQEGQNTITISTGGATAYRIDANQNSFFEGNAFFKGAINLGPYTNAQEGTLVTSYLTPCGATCVGTIWVNTDLNKARIWDGTQVQEIATLVSSAHTNGGIITSNGTQMTVLNPGTNGQILQIVGGVPSWQNATSTVTSVSANAPLAVTNGTTTPDLSLNFANGLLNNGGNLEVDPGTGVTVDATGVNVTYGTTANTAVEGNDSRLQDATKFQGRDVVNTAPTDGQVIKWNNALSRWEPAADTDTNSGGTVTNVSGTAPVSVTNGTTTPNISISDATAAAKGIMQVGGGLNVSSGTVSVDIGTGAGQVMAADGVPNCSAGQKLQMSAGPVFSWSCVDDNAVELQGRDVANTAPTDGQVLKWNNAASRWEPATDNNSGGTVTSVSGSGPVNVANDTTTPSISIDDATAATKGVVQVGNGIAVSSGTISADPGTGVTVDGTGINVTYGTTANTAVEGNDSRLQDATKIQGRDVVTTAPTNGQVLKWNNALSRWEPAADIDTNDNLGNHTATTDISMATNKITGLGDPTAAQDAATKNYVDANWLGNSVTAPGAGQDGQAIRWNNTGGNWEYFTPQGGTVTSVSGSGPVNVSNGTTTPSISIDDATAASKGVMQVGTGLSVSSGTVSVSYGTSANSAVEGNDSRLQDATKIQGRDVVTTAPTDGQVLKWNNAASRWEPAADSSVGDNLGNHTATTDLAMATNKITGLGDPTAAQDAATKNYTDANLRGQSLAAPAAGQDGQSISWDNTAGNWVYYTPTTGTVTSVSGSGPINVANGTTTPSLSIDDATGAAKGVVQVGTGIGVSSGTISVNYGTTANTAVEGNDSRLQDATKLQGRDLVNTAPTDGQVLKWNNAASRWEPANDTDTGDNLGNHTATTDLSMATNKITGLGDPTAAQDAATKNYSDANLRGQSLAAPAAGQDGQSISWDNTAGNWVYYTPTTGTVTSVSGSGPVNVSNGTTTPSISIDDATAASKGIMQVGGGLSVSSGTVSADIGTGAGQVMGADAVPNCAVGQKLQMSAGPVYSWSCVEDNAVDLQGRDVANTAPTNGQVLKWNNALSQWEPAADNNAGGTVTSVSGSGPVNVANGTTTPSISIDDATAAAKGVVQIGNGIAVSSGTISADPGTGVTVDGTGINVTYGTTANTAVEGNDSRLQDATKLQGRDLVNTAPTDGQVLKWNNAASRWEPAADINTNDNLGNHTATTDLAMATNKITGLGDPTAAQDAATKNYTDANLRGQSLAAPAAGQDGQSISWDNTAGNWVYYTPTTGTVTSVSGSGPINVTNGTTTPSLSIDDATAAAKGVVQVGTGLGVSSGTISVNYGTTANTAVEGNDSRLQDATKIQGRDVVNTAPADGQILKWNNAASRWEPANDSSIGDNLGNHTATTDLAMATNKITGLGDPTAAQDAATKNYTDANLRGQSLAAPAAGQDGQSISWDNTAGNWVYYTPTTGTVTSVSGSGPVNITNGTTTPNITIDDATAAAKGIMQVGTGLGVSSGTVSVNFGTTANTAVEGNDSRLQDATKLQGRDLVNTAPADGQVLKWNNAASRWEPAADTNTNDNLGNHTATTDLAMATNKITGLGDPTTAQDAATKNYTDANLRGQSLAAPGAGQDGQSVSWDNTAGNWVYYTPATGTVTSVSGSGPINVTNGTTTPSLSIDDATAAAKGVVQVGTGLGVSSGTISVNYGSTANTAVEGNDSRLQDATKLQGRDLVSTAPTDGQVLKWNNAASRWEPAADDDTGDNLGNHTATTDLAMGTNKITGLGNPTAAQDAATKTYVDSNWLGTSVTAPAAGQDGQVLRWNNTGGTWDYFTPTNGTVTNVSGSGPVNVSNGTTTPSISIDDATAASKGIMQVGGGLSVSSGTVSADIGTGAGQVMASDGVPSCTAGQKLQMSAGPVYSWSCVDDNAVDLQGRDVASTAPTDGQVLKWNNAASRWEPSSDNNAGGTVTSVSGNGPINVANGTSTPSISIDDATAAAKGVVQVGTGISVSSGTISADPGTGITVDGTGINVTYGTTANTAVEGNDSRLQDATKIQGRDVVTTAPSDGQVLKWNNAASRWEPAADTNTNDNLGNHTATTDLAMATNKITGLGDPTAAQDAATKNYTDANLRGQSLAAPAAGQDGQSIGWDNTAGNWVYYTPTSGTVTSVSGSGPINVTNGTTTPSLSIDDATAAAKGVVQVGTGLGVSSGTISVNYGTTANTAVEGNDSRLQDATKLQGRDLVNTAPTDGQVLKWNNAASRWEPAADADTGDNLGNHTATTNLAMGTNKITGLGNPTAAQDAATKTYVDSNWLGTSVTAPAAGQDGQVLRWNNAGGSWDYFTPTSGTVTSVSGSGPVNVSNGTTTPSISIDDATAAAKGIVQIGNGLSVSSGTVSANFGTGAGQVMGADAVPNCTASQKLQMSAGPVYSWSCVDDNAVDLQGRDVANTAPTDGQVLKWNNAASRWEPAADTNTNDNLGNHTATTDLAMATNKITGLGDPTAAQDAATKNYTDANLRGQSLAAPGAGQDGQSISWDNTAGNWVYYTPTTGTVTSVSGSGPVNVANGTSTPSISIDDATAAAKGIMQVGTGLSVSSGTVSVSYGTAANTAVEGNDSRLQDATKLQGRDLVNTAPTDGQVLKWNNAASRWEPAADTNTNDNLGNHTATTDLAMATNKITGLGDPTAAQDAATKNYVDANLRGQSLAAPGAGQDGQSISWDNTAGNWVYYTATNGTVTSVSGSGPVNVSNGTTTPSISIDDATAASKGIMQVGSGLSVSSGTVSADIGTGAGQVMGADAVSNCAVGQKLQMSAGPVYSWSCVDDNAVDIQGRDVANTAPTDGQVLTWNNGASQWEPQTASASDATKVPLAGGTMTGTLNLPSNGLVVGTTQLVVSGGQVGIGTATPGQDLDVNGNVQATAFFYSSDARLKTNITPVSGLETILALHGVEFDWIESGKHEIGLIAQDVEKVLPDLVHTNPDTGMKSVKYGNLVAPLIEATKDLHQMCMMSQEEIEKLQKAVDKNTRSIASVNTEVSDLKNQVNDLKEENKELRKELDEIKAMIRAMSK